VVSMGTVLVLIITEDEELWGSCPCLLIGVGQVILTWSETGPMVLTCGHGGCVWHPLTSGSWKPHMRHSLKL